MLNGKGLKKYDFCDACMFYLGAIVVLLLGQGVAGVLAAALGSVVPNIASDGNFNTAFMIVLQCFSAAFIVLYTRLGRREFNFVIVNEGLKNKKISPLAIILPIAAAVVLMVGMFLPTIWYGYFTQYVLRIPSEAGQVDLSSPAAVVMIVIASVFLAPICEETIYRGVLFNGLKSEFSPVKAIVLSAVAFMLMHMNAAQVVFQLALGVVSAVIMYYGGRLISCILLHAAANSLALVIELTPVGDALGGCVAWMTNNIAAAVFITLGLLVAACGIMFVIVWFGFKRCCTDMQKCDGAAQETEHANSVKQADEVADGEDEAADLLVKKQQITGTLRKKDGSFRYCIAAGICGVMFIINTVVSIL